MIQSLQNIYEQNLHTFRLYVESKVPERFLVLYMHRLSQIIIIYYSVFEYQLLRLTYRAKFYHFQEVQILYTSLEMSHIESHCQSSDYKLSAPLIRVSSIFK